MKTYFDIDIKRTKIKAANKVRMAYETTALRR